MKLAGNGGAVWVIEEEGTGSNRLESVRWGGDFWAGRTGGATNAWERPTQLDEREGGPQRAT